MTDCQQPATENNLSIQTRSRKIRRKCFLRALYITYMQVSSTKISLFKALSFTYHLLFAFQYSFPTFKNNCKCLLENTSNRNINLVIFMAWPAILCYVPHFLVPSDTEEQTEMLVFLSLFIESQTVFPFFHTPNYICHLIFSWLLLLNCFLKIRQLTSVKGHLWLWKAIC